MHLFFFGSDKYSEIVLTSLLHGASFAITLVAPSLGSQVAISAKKANVKILLYHDLLADMSNLITPDSIGLSASFPHLFPPSLIQAFGGKLYNLHPSLLPQYRNVAPVPYTLAMGDTVTGISLFPVSIGIDSGELVAQQKHNISPTDTTPILLEQLFLQGSVLFRQFLANPKDPSLTSDIPVYRSRDLVFTRKLTRQTGFIEWEVLQKLLTNQQIDPQITKNELIILRLAHHPTRQEGILPDLIRALDGYERVWSSVPTRKGSLDISLSLANNVPGATYQVLLPGKPRPIPYTDFKSYYL